MQLPPALRQAVDRALEGISLADLKQAAQRLSDRYRAEIRDGRLHLSDDLAARAYLATRLPATFAAIAASYEAAARARPDFAPRSILDVGAGPGTATWAATCAWDSVESSAFIEASTAIRAVGETFAASLPFTSTWHDPRALRGAAPRDLVVLAYVLDELNPVERAPLLQQLWQLTRDVLILVEPGTPAGWKRILEARALLTDAGAHLLAPCPHAAACPLIAPDWCHFAARVERSRLHRQAKSAEVPWEDEKFIYLVASRTPAAQHPARVLAPPKISKADITLKLCRPDGASANATFAKRDAATFRLVRKLDWGDEAPIIG